VPDFLLNVRARLASNAPDFIRDIQRQLRALDQQAAKAPRAPRPIDAETAAGVRAVTQGGIQKTRLLGAIGQDPLAVSALAQQRIASATHVRDINRAAWEQARATGIMAEGTRTQRMQARFAEARGGEFRRPTQFSKMGEGFQRRFISSAEYMASGAVLYGGMTFAKDVLDEAGDLQQQLSLVQSAFRETDAAAQGISFEQFREELRGLSTESGVAVSEVANVTRQLAGAFADPQTGTPDFTRAIDEADSALKFSRITGLPQQEITDSMTAISLAFDRSFTEIADATTYLSRSFGVVETDIVRFTADLAPLGQELGFSAEQMSALGAVAQQASGRSGTALAEQFGRILPSLQSRQADLLALFQENPLTQGVLPELGEAFNTGQIDQVLRILIENYGRLDDAQKNSLASLVGGRREAAAFYAVLDRGAGAIRALSEESNGLGRRGLGAGEAAKRWEAFSKTFQQSMTEVRRAIEDVAIQLFQAGIDDALKLLTDTLKGVAGAAELLLSVFAGVNDLFGNLPGKVMGAVIMFRLLRATMGPLGGVLGGAFGRGGAGAAGAAGTAVGGGRLAGMAAGFLSPYGATPGQLRRPVGWIEQSRGFRVPNFLPFGMPGVRLDENAQQRFALRNMLTRADTSGLTRDVNGRLRNAQGQFAVRAGVGGPGTSTGQVSSGVGTAIGGAIGFVAPIIGTMIVGELFNRIGKYKAELKTQLDDFDDKVADAAKRGMTEEEVRAELGGVVEERGFMGVARQLGSRIFFQEESAAEQGSRRTTDVYQRRRAPAQKQLAQEVLDNPAMLQRMAENAARTRNFGDRFSKEEKRRYGTGVLDETVVQNYTEDFTRAAQEYLASSGVNNEQEDNFMRFVDFGRDKRVTEFLAIATEENELSQRQADALEERVNQSERRQMRSAEAARKYGEGDIGFEQYRRTLEREITNQRAIVEGLPQGSEARLEAENTLAEMEERLRNTQQEAIKTRYEMLRRTASFGGQEATAAQNLVFEQQEFSDIRATGTATADELGNAAAEYVAARDAAWIEAIENADSYAEAMRLMAAGPGPIPQEQLDALNMQVLATGDASTFATFVQEALDFASLDESKNFIIDMYNQYGEAWYANVMALIDAQIEQNAARLKALSGPAGAEVRQGLREEQAALVGSRAQYAALGAAIQFVPGTAPGAGGPGSAAEAATGASRDRERREYQARAQIRDAGVRDAVERARRRVETVRGAAQFIDRNAEDYDAQVLEHEAELADAEAAYQDALEGRADKIADGASALAQARARGNPMALAMIAVADARRALAEAEPEDRDAALANLMDAEAEAAETQRAIANAELEFAAAEKRYQGDMVGAALDELELANRAVIDAGNDAERRWAALGRQLEANKAVRDALHDAFAAQQDIAAALYEAAGDPVNAARTQLDTARDAYNRALAAGVRGPELDRIQADYIRQQTSFADAQRNARVEELDYLLEFDKITVEQYVNYMRDVLNSIPESNWRLRAEIERKIRAVREEMQADLNFNLPTNLRLPTLYEARRLGQSTGGTYNENRVVNITLNANNAIDGAAAVQTIVDAINGPPRVGVTPRLY
jgi:hypothetical protein